MKKIVIGACVLGLSAWIIPQVFKFGNTSSSLKILKRGNGTEPQSLDPHKTSGVPESNITLDQLEGLLSTAADGQNIPGVAERWEVSSDGKTYTFFLRQNAKWSNGDPVTANDFVYAWQRMVNPLTASNWTYIIQPVKNAKEISKGEKQVTELGVKADGDYKLIVELNAPTPYFLSLAAHSCMVPLHKKTVEASPDKWMRPGSMVGNGAFVLDEWMPQSHVKLKKNPHYWASESVKLDGVIFYPIDDRQSELKRFKAGDLHMTKFVPADQIEILKKTMPECYKSDPAYATYFYTFNHTKPPFDNPKVRQALTLAINRDALVAQVTKGDEKPAYSFVPPAPGDYIPQEMQCKLTDSSTPVPCKTLTQEQRETLAKKILAESGYKSGAPIELVYNTDENHKKIAIALSSMWKSVLGVQTQMNNKEWKVYLSAREKRDYNLYRQVWRADYNDPSTFLILFKSDSGNDNTAGYNSPSYDVFMEQSAKLSGKTRMEAMMNAEKDFMSNFSVAPLYYFVTNCLVAKNVSGYKGSPMDYHLSKWMSISN